MLKRNNMKSRRYFQVLGSKHYRGLRKLIGILIIAFLQVLTISNVLHAADAVKNEYILLHAGNINSSASLNYISDLPDKLLLETNLFTKVYSGMTPIIKEAYIVAEAAIYESKSLPSKTRDVRLIILPKGFPYGLTYAGEDSIDILITGGLFDYAVWPHRAFAEDILSGKFLGSISGSNLYQWYDQLTDAGGKSCDYRVNWPQFPEISDNDSVRISVMTNAQLSTLAFIFAHELVHVNNGDEFVRKKMTKNQIEEECDRIAFRKLMGSGKFSPASPIITFTSLGYWENLRGPRVRSFNFPEDKNRLSEILPQRTWNIRAKKMLSYWAEECKKQPDAKICAGNPKIQAKMITYLENLMIHPSPKECKN